MFYSKTVEIAMRIAAKAHEGQTDKSGYTYIHHPLHLAEQFYDENSVVVALLHDVAEDTSVTLDDLTTLGFNPSVLQALDLLTHREGVPYMDYIGKIKENPLARRVKVADLKHNCDVSRGADTEYFRQKRKECYYPALEMLLAEEGNLRVKNGEKREGSLLAFGTILIQDKRLLEKGESKKIEDFLLKEGFRPTEYSSRSEGMFCLYVCLDTKVYSYGKPCVGLTPPLGGKAVSLDEFFTIYNIYKPNRFRDDCNMIVCFRDLRYDEEKGKWVINGDEYRIGEFDPRETTLEKIVMSNPLGVFQPGLTENCRADYSADVSLVDGVEAIDGAEAFFVRYNATSDADNAVFYTRPK